MYKSIGAMSVFSTSKQINTAAHSYHLKVVSSVILKKSIKNLTRVIALDFVENCTAQVNHISETNMIRDNGNMKQAKPPIESLDKYLVPKDKATSPHLVHVQIGLIYVTLHSKYTFNTFPPHSLNHIRHLLCSILFLVGPFRHFRTVHLLQGRKFQEERNKTAKEEKWS
uniref:Uncharacterized protein n=1 Tax=Strigamia maritima TaxID=126957 RepID=T1IV72_STRMM